MQFIFLYPVFDNLYCWGLIDPRNFYSPFLAKNLDYFSVITSSILQSSSLFLHWFKVNTLVQGKLIYVVNGTSLSMDVPCIGLGIMFFWMAYIIAGTSSLKHKIEWCLGGLAAIWFINCLRVTLLMYSLENKWNIGEYVDAHDLFNYTAYSIIVLFIWLEGNSHKTKPENVIHYLTHPLVA